MQSKIMSVVVKVERTVENTKKTNIFLSLLESRPRRQKTFRKKPYICKCFVPAYRVLTTCHVLLPNGVISLTAVSFPRNCDRDLMMIGTVTMIIMMMIMVAGRVMVKATIKMR